MKKGLLLFFLFIISIYIGFKYLDKSNIEIDDKGFVNLLVNYSTNKISSTIFNISDPRNLLSMGKVESSVIKTSKEEVLPLIYIYNTHQSEEYKSSDLVDYSINPTVMINDYIMESIFNKNNYKTIVEERSIKDILNINKWKYYYSYKASRMYMEDIYKNNSSLKYFIDVHRDSLDRDKTTISINSKSYAKILFIVGLENSNYQSNLEFTEKINNIINKKYPDLSKGIYKKGGEGVNGVYNQDFSPNTILVEIGGNNNTISEVMNTSIAFSECFLEAINE